MSHPRVMNRVQKARSEGRGVRSERPLRWPHLGSRIDSCWAVTILAGGHLAAMTAHWLRGVVLEGGVAGGVPPHKGGPKARPPKKQERGERSEE